MLRVPVTFLELTGAFFREIEASLCLRGARAICWALAAASTSGSCYSHRALTAFRRIFSFQVKKQPSFSQLFSNRTWLSRGRRTQQGWRVFIPKCGQCLPLGCGKKWEFQRNSHLTRSRAHTESSPTFYKEEMPIENPDLSHIRKREWDSALKTVESKLGQRNPRCLDVFHCSTMAGSSSANVKPWIIRFNNSKWNSCLSSKLFPSTSWYPFLSYSINPFTVSNKNSYLNLHLPPVA